MRIFALGQTLEEIDVTMLEMYRACVILCDTSEADRAMSLAEMQFEGEINLNQIGFCRMEVQQECLSGALRIPKLLDVLGSCYKIQFFINKRNIVIVDDSNFTERKIRSIRNNRTRQGQTREVFLYNYLTQLMSRDVEILDRYEKRIMILEENVISEKECGFQSQIIPIRRELLVLRGFYDEIMDLAKELEEDENHFFSKKQLKYFGTIADRADRLMGKTVHLLEYAQQVRDAYQANLSAAQNRDMQFLTVISTIFFPLTLITGWYGMNFQNMPELEHGYPAVIVLSLIVLIICIIIFKKKKIF